MYEIACSFPALNRKCVDQGHITGIEPDCFCAETFADFINGHAGAWSSGEYLILEFLLNLGSPGTYSGFNMGRAVNVWDGDTMTACFKAVAKIYTGQ